MEMTVTNNKHMIIGVIIGIRQLLSSHFSFFLSPGEVSVKVNIS